MTQQVQEARVSQAKKGVVHITEGGRAMCRANYAYGHDSGMTARSYLENGTTRRICPTCQALFHAPPNKDRLTPALRTQWDDFLAGKWQREMPDKVGTYPVATRSGYQTGLKTLTRAFEQPIQIKGSPPGTMWDGWWWSSPIPKLPEPPEWEE